ncbi:MAG: hypothetical protein R3257_03200 [bacterium]|nr:hypothetical protein [bacterium]
MGSFSEKKEALALAKEASYRLRYPIAREEVNPPLKFPFFGGKVIQIIRPLPKTFQVLGYLGFSSLEAKAALEEIRKFFPQAKLLALKMDPSETDPSYSSPPRRRLLVMGQADDFQEAQTKAEKLSLKTGLPFTTRGMVFEPGRGWAWPEDYPRPMEAGVYFARKFNKECEGEQVECITIERSDFYRGFTKGRYLILGGVYETGAVQTKPMLKKVKKTAKRAYLQTSEILLSCAP